MSYDCLWQVMSAFGMLLLNSPVGEGPTGVIEMAFVVAPPKNIIVGEGLAPPEISPKL